MQAATKTSMTNIETLADLMRGHKAAEIICAVRGIVIRRLVVCDDTLEIDASGPWGREEFAAPLSTAISLRSWFMDRGDVLTTADGQTIKLCTEHDQHGRSRSGADQRQRR